jgi:hypothetical protein
MLRVGDRMRLWDMQVLETPLAHYLTVAEVLPLLFFLLLQDPRRHC